MADPISAISAAQSVAKPPQMDTGAVGGPSETKGPSFQDVFQKADEVDGPSAVDASAPPEAVQDAQRVQEVQSVEKPEMTAKIDRFIESTLHDEQKMDAMMDRCMSGKTMSNSELLQMQGLVYGYSQKVELATKLVDKATGGLKQIMNTQV